MDDLVAEDQVQLVGGIGPQGQHHLQGPAEQANRQGGGGVGGDHQGAGERLHLGLVHLLLPDVQDFLVRDGPCSFQQLPPEAQVGQGVPPEHGNGPHQPQPQDQPDPIPPGTQHESGGIGQKGGVEARIEKIGQEPQHGAAPGADKTAEQGCERQEQGIIGGDVKKALKAQGQRKLRRAARAHDHQPKEGQQHQGQGQLIGVHQRLIVVGEVVAGAGSVVIAAPEEQGKAHKQADGGEREQTEDVGVCDAHNFPPFNRSRSSSSSWRVSPLLHRALAKVDRLPPHSWSKNRRLCPAR